VVVVVGGRLPNPALVDDVETRVRRRYGHLSEVPLRHERRRHHLRLYTVRDGKPVRLGLVKRVSCRTEAESGSA